jgi:antitoxin VapB
VWRKTLAAPSLVAVVDLDQPHRQPVGAHVQPVQGGAVEQVKGQQRTTPKGSELKAVATIGRHQVEGWGMDTAKLFSSGRSQAVRLPKDYRFQGSEVAVKHFGNGVLLLPVEDPWATLEAGLASFEPGFVIERHQPEEQQREAIQP